MSAEPRIPFATAIPAERPVRSGTPLRAALLMATSAVLFGLMAIVMRLGTERGLHTFEMAFFRSTFGLLFALPLLHGRGLALLRTNHFRLYLLRGALGAGSMLASFWALAHLPLAQAVAISFSTPLFVTVGAVLLLGEIVRARRWSAVVIGFLGVLVIMRPGSVHFSEGMLVALCGAMLAASAYISIKFLSRSEPADAIVIYMTAIMCVVTLPLAISTWTSPDATGWLWAVLVGLLGTAGQITMTRAYHMGEVSALAPLNYLQLPVVSICAWFVFAQSVDAGTLAGAAIIIAANLYIAHRETRLARRGATDAELASGESSQPI
ncbi:MAG: DMT family transporter [Rudaea sp.]|uniref:DMT family transporter n=1 Tax=Rudaea sp. TaxID=2136325 RepID=UPI0039E2342B